MEILSQLVGCKIGALPHNYLGLPLCPTKPRLVDFLPMLQRIESRLLSCSTLLSTGDKLTLIKSVFTSMPTFFMSTLMIPKKVIKQINTYLMNCFWRKYGMEEAQRSLLGKKFARPKTKEVLEFLIFLVTTNAC